MLPLDLNSKIEPSLFFNEVSYLFFYFSFIQGVLFLLQLLKVNLSRPCYSISLLCNFINLLHASPVVQFLIIIFCTYILKYLISSISNKKSVISFPMDAFRVKHTNCFGLLNLNLWEWLLILELKLSHLHLLEKMIL